MIPNQSVGVEFQRIGAVAKSRGAKKKLVGTVSAVPLILAGLVAGGSPAYAQIASAPSAQNAQSTASVEEIVVTGTRIIRDGYEAPTPLTVLGIEEIQKQVTGNVADFVNTLPAFSGSLSPSTSQASVSAGTAGINALNLRSLGSPRTLVLLDGQRSVGSVITGLVDVNDFPQELVSRVDVVTGGASAAYGSDALSGVVNFVLDKRYTGIKGEVSGGVTSYGDNRNWKTVLTAGTGFANDRGHFLASGEIGHKDGILISDREWNQTGWGVMLSPLYTATNGLPERLVLPQVGLSNAARGGLITSGPLKGTAFGPGGMPYQFNYGPLTRDPSMQGGDWKSAQLRDSQGNSIDSLESHQSVFSRASYQITDNFEAFFQASWANHRVYSACCPQFQQANITVKADNAFIPAAVAARVVALGLTTLQMGSMNQDIPTITTDNIRSVNRYVVGANGKIAAFSSEWAWDAYFQKGFSRSSENILTTSRARFAAAIDAVRSPTTGAIICRSTLTNPTTGCVPYNLFGIGVNSQAGLNYIRSNPYRYERLNQDVGAATLQGEPFAVPAGPVSVAVGVEHRKESIRGISDSESQATDGFAGNFRPSFGSYTVTEGFIETVIPVAKDQAWARAWDLNAAARGTDYSTSGYVTTWKVGTTYSPIDDLRFRVTRSRDIRAPNLAELFQAGTSNTNTVLDPFNGNLPISYRGEASGNLLLRPEKADTTGLGVVLQPSFVPGFSTSFDYYIIDIADAIGNIGNQAIVDNCFTGNQDLCAAITRGVNATGVKVITVIKSTPFNLITQNARGFDIEASYRSRLEDLIGTGEGNLTVRFLATHYIKNYSSNGINAPTNTAGENAGGGPPKWRWMGSISYAADPYIATLSARGLSSGVYDNSFIECTSGCPTSTVTNPTINDNHIAGAVYLDAAFSYRIMASADAGVATEAFFNVKNLANTDPAVRAPGPGGTPSYSLLANGTLYDLQGRVFRAGVRFKR